MIEKSLPKILQEHQLRRALQEANIPTLLIVLAQLTGDVSDLTAPELPSSGDIDGVRHMSPARQQAIRDRAVTVLGALQQGALTVPPLPDTKTLQHLASKLVGENVAREYIPMMLQDMGFVPSAQKSFSQQRHRLNAMQDSKMNAGTKHDSTLNDGAMEVIIVGAGIAGLCMAIHLSWAGISYRIIEKNPTVGGTWYENTYPACGVDTPNHFYSFSFEPNTHWPDFYSKRDDLQAYLEGVADKYKVRSHITFDTHVVKARYQKDTQTWQVTTRAKDGKKKVVVANILIGAVGQINRPKVPAIDGAQSFKGPAFHSARWQAHHDLKGKNIAVIGTGASAMQFAPEIAAKANTLTLFQRSKQWIRLLSDYHRTVGEGKRWLLRHVPYYRNWYRFKLFWVFGDGIWQSIHVDSKWPHKDRSLNADNEKHRKIYVRSMARALGNRKDLMDKVIPSYPPFAKRMLIDNHWCAMLQRDNVELVTQAIDSIKPHGVVDADGRFHKADVIIYATGFHAHRFLWPMEIVGLSGKTLAETWQDDARAYLGMSAPDFPNLFFLYGPNTNLGHGGSIIFHLECQARYISQCLLAMQAKGVGQLEVRRTIHDAYNARVDGEHARMVWSHDGVNNWYKNSRGRVVSNSPWRLVDYWEMTQTPNMDHYYQEGAK